MPLFVQDKSMGAAPKSVQEFLQRYPHFKVIYYVHVSHSPIPNLFYYTSHEFPIQNFHRRTTGILYYHPCYSDGEYCHTFAIAAGDSINYKSFGYDARRRYAYSSFMPGYVQQQWRT